LAICMDGNEPFFAGAKKTARADYFAPVGRRVREVGACRRCGCERINDAEVAGCRRCVDAAREKAKQLGAGVYCVANTVGWDGERGYPGNSWIVSPAGEILVYLKGTAIIEEA